MREEVQEGRRRQLRLQPISMKNLVEEMLVVLPELDPAMSGEREFWGTCPQQPSAYQVFGFVLKPHLKSELLSQGLTPFVSNFLSFSERVCNSDDEEAINVLWIKIFEWLIHDPDALRKVWPVMGNKTRETIRDAAARWEVHTNIPEL